MSLELAGPVVEHFESRLLPEGIELTGTGRLRRLSIEFPGWLTPRQVEDAVGMDIEHELGVTARVRLRSGQRIRIEIALESDSSDLVTVPGPVLRVEGPHRPVSWLAGASAEIVLPSDEGPGLLTQRRGLSTPGGEPGVCHPLEAEVTLRARHLTSSAWTYEAQEGDLLDVPSEPTWLPWVRYVERGRAVEIIVPDGVVTVDERTSVDEVDDEFEVYPPEGLSTVGIWGAGGQTLVEVGAHRGLPGLRSLVAHEQPHDDAWCYVALRHLLESQADDELLDRIDWVLGDLEDSPTAWSACASKLATQLGLPLAEQADRAATTVLARGRADDVLLLAMHQLVPVDVASGGWPVGDFDRVGVEAIAALSYGRINTDDVPERGRDVAVAKLYAAGLGESERGLHAAACAQVAEGRLLSSLSVRPNPTDLAWLSIQ